MIRSILLLTAAALSGLLPSSRALSDEPLPPAVSVHIDSDSPVDLYTELKLPRHKPSAASKVCSSPCDRPVGTRPDAVFFVESDTVPRSRAFPVEGPGPTRIEVDTGSRAQRVGGVVTLTLGGATMVGGITAMVLSLVPSVFEEGKSNDEHSLLVGGGVTLGIGAAVTTIGIVLAATSGTHVDLASPRTGLRSPLSFSF